MRRILIAALLMAGTLVPAIGLPPAAHAADSEGVRIRLLEAPVEWTTVTPSSVDLAPGEATEATVAVDIPRKVFGGERYGVVWAELPGSQSQSGVTTVNRVGIRMSLSVGGPKEPPSDFTSTSSWPAAPTPATRSCPRPSRTPANAHWTCRANSS